ncbi:hypothetical protein G6M89_14980 [Natronolimnobius sp. AArcel1]|uniref:DUF7573 domain-containing protein n=1 Tax=Natronolimnobius sp. AArcel1 TaxID=1679093 RepID=UPI0013EA0C75|nr:hypothetical protein [Natronolimnobius sp. AArcel1]NGM70297.1 hypothetical protein [Natronolimnobius sp. AArcel1]
MSDDARLSDFSREPAESGDDSGEDENENESDAEPMRSSVESDSASALATYAWGEYVCARCETDSERVWKDDDVFVCPDCKDW